MKNIEFVNLKENVSFIEGWVMDDLSLCDEIIKFYELNRDNHREGLSFDGVNKEIKDSTDLAIFPKEINKEKYLPISDYLKHLDVCYKKYLNKYRLDSHFTELHIGPFNIQKYSKGGHFNSMHSERMGIASSSRLFAWMTYLNDVNHGGETEFLYYNEKIKPKKGLTLIWPSEWTHMHKGSITDEVKYIITGWMHFPDKNDGDQRASIQII